MTAPATSRPVAAWSPSQPGIPLTSSRYTLPSRAGSRSTPAYSAPTAAAARTGSAAAREVGPPPGRAALDGGEDPAAHHEGSDVAAVMMDGPLEVVDPADRF